MLVSEVWILMSEACVFGGLPFCDCFKIVLDPVICNTGLEYVCIGYFMKLFCI